MYNAVDLPNLPECEACPLSMSFNEVEVLYEIALSLTSNEDIFDLIERNIKTLKHYTNIERFSLYLLNDEKGELELKAAVNLTAQQRQIATYKLGEGATGMAAQSGEPVVIENIKNNISYLNKLGSVNLKAISYVAVPLIKDEEVAGVFSANMGSECPMDFNAIIRLMTIVGTLFIGALRQKQHFDEERNALNDLKTYYKSEVLNEQQFENIIGKSTKMQQIFSLIDTVAPTDATVLVRGETGTGKELIATAIHNLSNRQNGPFVKLNCAAISETLLESELFGHEKGAFTDAKEMRKGRFEIADSGTLFLDEIGDITQSLQVKLLRILQEQEFERVGGTKTIKTNVRLVAATNRNLEEMVKKGEFREDLYYRLNVIPINLPPLRERYEDVRLLMDYYMKRFMKEHNKSMVLSKKSEEILLDYPWPGNIRELQNTMERLVLICPNGEIQPEMLNHVLPFNYQKLHVQEPVAQESVPSQATETADPQAQAQPLTKSNIQEIEKEAIVQALIENRGIQTKAAKQLGMSARQIGYKIKKYNIEL